MFNDLRQKVDKLTNHSFVHRRKFKRSLTMTSLPLAFFKGCTSGNQDPNSPDSPVLTNGNGNVIGNYNQLFSFSYNQNTL